MHKGLEDTGMGEEEWYEEARASREGWRAPNRWDMESCKDAQTQASVAAKDVVHVCEVCLRTFQKSGRQQKAQVCEGEKEASE